MNELWGAMPSMPVLVGLLLLVIAIPCCILFIFVFAKLGIYWFQAYMCGADISIASLIAISLLRLDVGTIVNAKIIARQAGLRIDHSEGGMTTSRLLTHALAGGSIMDVVTSLVLAQRAGIDLDFDRAACVDLTGRDLLQAIQTSISPKVIQCPSDSDHPDMLLSAVAKDGVELRVRAKITVRTNMHQLVGGATDATIVARVGQMIISAIGSADSHTEILASPSLILSAARTRHLDQDTAYAMVSIDIAQLVVGKNIGASLRIDQAQADMRIATARAEIRRANAVALTQEMSAKIAQRRVELVRAEALIAAALAYAIREPKSLYTTNPNNIYPRAWNESTDQTDDDKRTAS